MSNLPEFHPPMGMAMRVTVHCAWNIINYHFMVHRMKNINPISKEFWALELRPGQFSGLFKYYFALTL
jgi:hypothetical protein